MQHRAFRQRDTDGAARCLGGREARDQAPGGRVYVPRRPPDLRAGGGAPGEPRLRYGTSVVRHVELVHEPVPRTAGAVARTPRSGRIPPAEAPRRGGCPPASGQPGRGAHAPHARAGRLHRGRSRGTV